MNYKNTIKNWFFRESHALPIDIFRILAGILSITYFYSLITQVKDFSSPDGIINHNFFLEHYPHLKINLIQPGLGDLFFYIVLGIALLLTTTLIIGYKPRISAFLLFIISTTIQRWNFAVVYVDDITMHLVFFWLTLLPTGNTLVLTHYLREGKKVFERWKEVKVNSFVLNCFLINVCWIYLFAGLTKLFSPMWYQGFAMYPILQIPIARFPDFWAPEHLPYLKIVTYVSLITEIALPFLLLSARNTIYKKAGFALQILFHLGIIATLKIPFANIALIATCVLFFREEIMNIFFKTGQRINKIDYNFGLLSKFALIMVILICISTMRNIPLVKQIARPVTSGLWLVGINQHYQLFDWIHRFNYKIDRKVGIVPLGLRMERKLEHTDYLPNSVRFTLFQLRNYDIRWIFHVNKKIEKELKKDIKNGIAKKYCRDMKRDGEVSIITTLHRITPDNIDKSKKPEKYKLEFTCYEGKALPANEYKIN